LRRIPQASVPSGDRSIDSLKRADLVITSAAGYPLDLTFYQMNQGHHRRSTHCETGGRILIVGECGEGAGSAEFARKLESYAGHRQYLDDIRDSAVEVDQWQLEKLL